MEVDDGTIIRNDDLILILPSDIVDEGTIKGGIFYRQIRDVSGRKREIILQILTL
jgi:hypothetical protein